MNKIVLVSILILGICLVYFLVNDSSDVLEESFNSSINNLSNNTSSSDYSNPQIIYGFVRPFAINFDNSGKIYVSDFGGHNILVYDENGELIQNKNPGIETLNGPHSLDFDKDGNWYVTDFLNKKIQKFSKDGTFSKTVMGMPILEGPATSYFDNDGNLLVSDYSSNSLIKISKEGNFLGWIGAKSDGTITNGWELDWSTRTVSDKPGGFDRLHSAIESKDGIIYVVDTWNNRIQKFSKEGNFLGWIGAKSDGTITNGWDKSGAATSSGKAGGFNKPIALDFSYDEEIFIFEFGNGRIQKFSKDGKFIEIVEDGFNQGYDLRFRDNKLYVVDTGNNLVKIIEI